MDRASVVAEIRENYSKVRESVHQTAREGPPVYARTEYAMENDTCDKWGYVRGVGDGVKCELASMGGGVC